MSLQYSDIDDAVLETQNNLINKGEFVNMSSDLSEHVAVREMWESKKKVFDGGLDWEFQVKTDHNHSARAVGLLENDGSSFHDTMKKGKVSVRHMNAHYIYDQREPDFQRGGHAIVDLVKSRYVDMMQSFYELLEEFLWGKPQDSSDTLTPYGIAYWVVKNALEGFHGDDPAGFSDGRAGISTKTFPRFANYSGSYASVSKEDLLRKMRRASRKSKFRSPISLPDSGLGGTKNGIYLNDAVIGLLEELLESQNMDLGNDLASKDGRTLFKGTPVTYAPYLDNDSTNPIYMLDWKYLAIGVMAGWQNNLSAPYMIPGKHTGRRVDYDVSLNMICNDPRRQAVLHLA